MGILNGIGMNKYLALLAAIIALALAGAAWYAYQIDDGPPAGSTPETTMKTVRLYYYNPDLDQDDAGNILCSRRGLIPVEREISVTQTPIQDAIRLLLRGELTAAERAEGITTEFPLPGFSLTGASLRDGALTLSFEDPQARTVGGACRTGILWFQIETTAKQFPEVQNVRFMPEELFQP